jgi:RNA polymerase sigma-70 factor (ECF subfamily)
MVCTSARAQARGRLPGRLGVTYQRRGAFGEVERLDRGPSGALSGTIGEGQLVDRARAGDAEAFGQLYLLHLERIYRYVYYRVGTASEAEDLTEHVFLKAWEAVGRYESRGLPFAAWLYRMAHNAVIDHYRASRPTTPIDGSFDLEDEKQSPTDAVMAGVDREELRRAIQRLSHDQQQVVVMRFVEGLSHADVAQLLGKSEGAVRVIQHRALRAMGRYLRSLPAAEHSRG